MSGCDPTIIMIENRTLDEIVIGDSAEITRVLTQQDIAVIEEPVAVNTAQAAAFCIGFHPLQRQ